MPRVPFRLPTTAFCGLSAMFGLVFPEAMGRGAAATLSSVKNTQAAALPLTFAHGATGRS